jgi:phage replication O-like protein O
MMKATARVTTMSDYQRPQQQQTEQHYTKVPNEFFDSLLADITSMCELKVTLALIRKTAGFHKIEDRVSLTQLTDATGLSRQGVIQGLALGMRRGTINRQHSGQGYRYSLRLQLVNDLDQSDQPPVPPTSQQNRLVLVNDLDQQLVNDLDPQKKDLNKILKEREREGGEQPLEEQLPPPPAPLPLIFIKQKEKGGKEPGILHPVPKPTTTAASNPVRTLPPAPAPPPPPTPTRPKPAPPPPPVPDPTKEYWAVKAWREMAIRLEKYGRDPWPNLLQRQEIARTVIDNPEARERWPAVLDYWAGGDYHMTNVKDLLDVFKNGTRQGQREEQRQQKAKARQERK